MQQRSNAYTFLYIIVTALVSALVLSGASIGLQKLQERNVELEIKKNILYAVGMMKEGCDVAACYRENIKSFVINSQGKKVDSSIPAEEINFEDELKKSPEKRALPVFQSIKGNNVQAYCIPIVGKGLWSTLYGYLALEPDLNTVKGVTFYKHAETPGLGAEIEKEWFLKNFAGKKIFNENGKLVSVTVVKGKVKENSPNKIHQVDGISGATLTSDGVTKLIRHCLAIYEPYVKLMRKEN